MTANKPQKLIRPVTSVTVDAGTEPDILPFENQQEGVKDGQAMILINETVTAIGAKALEIEDVHDMAGTFPAQDIDEDDPVKDETLLLAGAMVKLSQTDREAFSQAVCAAFKKIDMEGHLAKFDQSAAGLNAAALTSIAGAGEDQSPARLVYKTRDATFYERLRYWGRDGLTPNKMLPKWLRPGPDLIATDISYWSITRSVWHCMRVVKGVMRTTARPDIPNDAKPESVFSDDFRCVWGLPQIKTAGRKNYWVRNDVDVLAVAMGYRLGMGNLLLSELLEKIFNLAEENEMASSHGRTRATERREGQRSILKLMASWGFVFGFIIALVFFMISFGGKV